MPAKVSSKTAIKGNTGRAANLFSSAPRRTKLAALIVILVVIALLLYPSDHASSRKSVASSSTRSSARAGVASRSVRGNGNEGTDDGGEDNGDDDNDGDGTDDNKTTRTDTDDNTSGAKSVGVTNKVAKTANVAAIPPAAKKAGAVASGASGTVARGLPVSALKVAAAGAKPTLVRTAKIVTCPACRLNSLPQVKKFVHVHARHFKPHLNVQFKMGEDPVLHIFENGREIASHPLDVRFFLSFSALSVFFFLFSFLSVLQMRQRRCVEYGRVTRSF